METLLVAFDLRFRGVELGLLVLELSRQRFYLLDLLARHCGALSDRLLVLADSVYLLEPLAPSRI